VNSRFERNATATRTIPMTRPQIFLIAAAFLLAALGFYASSVRTSAQRAEACERVCAVQGKGFIVVPPGTAGRFVDGTSTKDESNNTCTCVGRQTAPR
jgi:hypothetical protein